MKRFLTQWLAWAAAMTVVVFAAPTWTQAQDKQGHKGGKMQGHIVRVQGSDRFVIRTADKREVILRTDTRTRFLLNERAIRFADLRPGAEVVILHDDLGDLASTVTVLPAATEDAEVVEGTIVRVIEPENQVVIRTAANKEFIVFTDARTSFMLNERAVRLVDFRPGVAVRINFHAMKDRNMARSIVAVKRLR